LGGVGLLLVAAVIAGVLALRASDRSRDSARTADAQRLGAQALIDDQLDRSLLLAQAGRELDDSLATRGYLLSALVRRPAAIGVMQGDGDPIVALALSPGGRILAAGDDDGTVILLDASTREHIGGPLQIGSEVGSIDFSPNGRLLAVAGRVGEAPDAQSVTLVDLTTRKVVRTIDVGGFPLDPGGFGVVADARFAGDGRTLVVSVTPDAPKGFAPYVRRYDARTGTAMG